MRAIRIDQPKIAFDYALEPFEVIKTATDYEYLELAAGDLAGQALKSVGFDGCRFISTLALNLKLESSQLLDCWIKAGDWSAAEFIDCGLRRVSIEGVRASGLGMSGDTVKSVQFIGCKLDFANFRQSKLSNVVFSECELDHADFSSAELTNVVFNKCNLSNAEFSKGTYSNVDLRSSSLDGLKGVADLSGATTDRMQLIGLLPQIALELGIELAE